MTGVNSTLLSILLGLGSILVVIIIFLIFRVAKTVAALQLEVTQLNRSILPLLERIATLTDSTQQAMEVITENRESITAATENFRKVSRNILRLEEILQRQVEPSLIGFASVLGGLRKGIQTFSDSWRRSHG
jgi:hypothetical protein